ncbi:unnamed protein product, partial [Allacma fusca]
MADLPTEATLDSCMDSVSELFNVKTKIPLSSIIVPESTFYCGNTTNLPHLEDCLQEVRLLLPNEHEILSSFNLYKRKQFLFHEVLNKRVERKEDYAKLIKALLKSGNKHIADRILEKLRSSSFETSIHAVNNNEQANGLLTGAENNSHYTHPDGITVLQGWIKISKYAIFPLIILAGFLILTLGNRMNHSSLMDQIAAKNKPLVLSTANSRAEDFSRTTRFQPSEMPTLVTVKPFQNSQHHQQLDVKTVKSIPKTDPLHVKNQLSPSSDLNLDDLPYVSSRLEDDRLTTDSVLPETITRSQSLEMLNIETNLEPLQPSQHHKKSDVKNISTTDPLEVKISEDEILPKYSSTEVYQKQLPTT